MKLPIFLPSKTESIITVSAALSYEPRLKAAFEVSQLRFKELN
jgi:hypothetical protein